MLRPWDRCEMHGEFEKKGDLGWDNINTGLGNGV